MVWDLGLRVGDLGLSVWGLGLRACNLRLRLSGLRRQAISCEGSGLGFSVRMVGIPMCVYVHEEIYIYEPSRYMYICMDV